MKDTQFAICPLTGDRTKTASDYLFFTAQNAPYPVWMSLPFRPKLPLSDRRPSRMSYFSVCVMSLGVCAFSAAAVAQQDSMPVGEAGVHWVYNNLETSRTGGWSNQNGASLYGQYFFKSAGRMWHGRSMLGIVADFSGSASQSGSLYTYLFGPRLSIEWRKSHLVFHAEYKIGGDHVRVNGLTQGGPNVFVTRNSFTGGGVGDGLDAVVSHHYVVSLFQIDFLDVDVPHSSGGGHWEGDMRISAGISYRFGQR
jgi:hypothetical protein